LQRGEQGPHLRDTGNAMFEESRTPDLVELVRRQWEAANRGDLDALVSLCRPDGVYDPSPTGLGVFEGPAAIRGFLEDYWGAFEDLRFELEEVLYLGNGVTFSAIRQDARPAGSVGYVRRREAYVLEWVEGMVARLTVYTDIDEARAAAERLAESRE
jgi:ketosteroid isomerase-like protein